MVKLSLTVLEQNINNIECCILAIRTTEEGQSQINAAFTEPNWNLWKYLWAEDTKYQLFSCGEIYG